MEFKKQLGKITVALLLFAAFMLPTAIQFFHLFEDHHEHVACKEISTHIHQDEPDCQIYNFHVASFNYDIVAYPSLSQPIIPVKITNDFSSLQLHSFNITNTQLRAPPIYS